MQRFFFVFFLFSFCVTAVSGQLKHSLNLGPDIGIPTTAFAKSTSLSFGGSIEYHLKFKAPIGLQARFGYNPFKDGNNDEVRFTPLRVGLVGYIFQDLLFVNADAGISQYYSPTTDTKKSGFSFGAGVGYRFPVSSNKFVQLSAYYNLHNYKDKMYGQNFNYSWFNLRAAFGISFGKTAKLNAKE